MKIPIETATVDLVLEALTGNWRTEEEMNDLHDKQMQAIAAMREAAHGIHGEHMTTKDKALKLALEKIADALPAYIDGVASREYLATVHKALAEQPAQQEPEQQEPDWKDRLIAQHEETILWQAKRLTKAKLQGEEHMTKVEEMWEALTAYQPQAVTAGHGESWAKMCREKTYAAAADAAYAAYAYSYVAYAYADPAAAAYAAAAYAYAADDAAAQECAQKAIKRINKVLIKPAQREPVAVVTSTPQAT